MTPTDIVLIRTSWAAVEPIADTAAGLFYARLFELDPAIERLFRRTDMAGQRKILMQTLTVVVKSLDKLDQIVIQGLALCCPSQRHPSPQDSVENQQLEPRRRRRMVAQRRKDLLPPVHPNQQRNRP